jgi:hypothetical protein
MLATLALQLMQVTQVLMALTHPRSHPGNNAKHGTNLAMQFNQAS